MRALIIICFIITCYLQYDKLGSTRRMLSTCVTFSNQTVLMMVAYTLLSKSRKIQDILTLYGIIICTVFYGIIVPFNGIPEQFIVDALIHISIPTLFIIQRGTRTFERITFSQFILYPVFYFVFIQLISARRGYQVYPFLNDPIGIFLVGLVFIIVHQISQQNKS